MYSVSTEATVVSQHDVCGGGVYLGCFASVQYFGFIITKCCVMSFEYSKFCTNLSMDAPISSTLGYCMWSSQLCWGYTFFSGLNFWKRHTQTETQTPQSFDCVQKYSLIG